MSFMLSKHTPTLHIIFEAEIVSDNEDKTGCILNNYGYHRENEQDVSVMGNFV